MRGQWRAVAECLLDCVATGHDAMESGRRSEVALARIKVQHADIRETYNQVVTQLHLRLAELRRENERRERVDATLRKSREDLRKTLDAIGDGVLSTDETAHITGMNSVAERLTGWPSEEAQGRSLGEVFRLVTSGPASFEVFPGEEGFDPEKVSPTGGGAILLSRQGVEYRITKSVAPIRQEDGEVLGTVVVFRDETESFRREQQLVQAQKMEAVGTLAGGLAHDLNNVLAGIVGPISLVEYSLASREALSREELGGYVSMIQKSSRRAADLVSRLLTISHGHHLSLAEADLNHCLENVVRIARSTFDKSIELCYQPRETPSLIWADPAQVEQVLLNLLINSSHALTFMRPEGQRWGGRLEVSLELVQVDECCMPPGETAEPGIYWVVRVEDEGIGIEVEALPQIFTPFFTTKEKGKGTGLGLAMVYNIVQKHLGFLRIDTEPGEGCAVSVFLPARTGEGGETEEVSSCLLVPRGEGVVLVVDDEEALLYTAREILGKCGYQVLVASGGKEGMDLFRKHHEKIDLVLLDVVMPGLSGDEVFEGLREIDPGVQVLLSSGFAQDDRVRRILEGGARAFLKKPYDLDSLGSAVKRILGDAGAVLD
jgi:PAS domain S-box-containing protein